MLVLFRVEMLYNAGITEDVSIGAWYGRRDGIPQVPGCNS